MTTHRLNAGVVEIDLLAQQEAPNPYQLEVDVELRGPSSRVFRVPAFHAGERRWKARFAPPERGRWTYRTVADEADLAVIPRVSGSFEMATVSRDFIAVSQAGPRPVFRFADGRAFIGIGDTAYGFTTALDEGRRARYAATRRAQGFNFVRLFAAGMPFETPPVADEDAIWAWGGTKQAPDYDRLNPRYFQRLEKLVDELAASGLRTEVLLINFYSLPFTDPVLWTPAREKAWLREVVARLAARPAVFLWTVANEYENTPDGKYRYDGPSDDAWVEQVAAQVRALDAQGHPLTVHNFTFDADGGVGLRFGHSPSLDVLTQQYWGRAQWNGRYLDGDADGIDAAIRTDLRYGKPVVNTENGYEWLPGYADFDQQVVGTDKARRAAWRALVGGASAYAAGFAGTWPGNDNFLWKGTGPLRFDLRDMGLGRQIRHLTRFLRRVDLSTLVPAPDAARSPALALARAEEEYLIYSPTGESVDVDLGDAGTYCRRWFDPRDGRWSACEPVHGGGPRSWRKPDSSDWVLWVTRR